MSVIPVDIAPVFRNAGWFEDRRVAVDAAVPMYHPSFAVLTELGGVVLRNPAPSVVSIAFQHGDDAAPDVAEWEAALGTKIVGVAEQDGGHAELYLTGRGQVLGFSLIHPACWLVVETFGSALQALTEGRRSKPMLLPGQEGVTLYGTRFHRGDAGVLGPTDLA